MLASGVHCDKDTCILVDFNSSPKQFKRRLSFLNSPLNNLNLLRDRRQLFFKESVELVEATPCSTFYKTNENSTHGFVVKAFIAIENQHLSTESLTQSLHTFSFTSTCWTIWISTVAHLHSQNKGEIALVSEGRVDEFGRVALVLEGVVEECVAHAYLALVALLDVDVILELLEPHPVVDVLRLQNLLVLEQLLHHIDVVDDVEDERFDLLEQQHVALVVERRVALKLPLQVLLVVSQLPRLHRLRAVLREADHLRQTADLRGRVHNVESLRLDRLLQECVKGVPHGLF